MARHAIPRFQTLPLAAAVVLIWLTACGGGGDTAAAPLPALKAWGTAALIESDNAGSAYDPQVAIDASGNALAVWMQSDGTRYNIWSSRYSAGTGWGTAALIESDNAGLATSPQIAVNGSGTALAVWVQSDGTQRHVVANRFTPGTGWGTPALIETDNAGSASDPQIAIDANGNAIAVWSKNGLPHANLMANRYTAGSGWGTAALIETDNAGNATHPRIVLDANGNALAVWLQSDGTHDNVWANRYTAGTGWGTAALLETDNAGDASGPQLIMDASGNALAVWSQFGSTQSNVMVNRYTVGSGWAAAASIGGALNTGSPQIAVDGSGNALAVWVQSDGPHYSIVANRYTVATGWGTAALIETDNAGDAGAPQIAFDASGNALAVWGQSDGTRINIWSNRYKAGTGWGTAALIETDNAGDANAPQIAIGANGQALAVWYQSDGTRSNVWSNRFQ
jgi:hypothetical protein